MKYNKENPLRVFTSFSGYDSQFMALDRLKEQFPDFEYERVGWCEIDKYAIKAHDLCYPDCKDKNVGDITKVDWSKVDDFDLFTYSSPCQSISQAGLQHGFTEGSGTRSSLLWYVRDVVIAKRPKYLLLENVAAMVSDKFIDMFNLWQSTLEELGYKNFAQVLNSKDYGVPQSRDRVFLVSIRCDSDKEYDDLQFFFPKPIKLEKCLGDVLEEDVDEKYYISDCMIDFEKSKPETSQKTSNEEEQNLFTY